jgi:hypothetical protein
LQNRNNTVSGAQQKNLLNGTIKTMPMIIRFSGGETFFE